MASDTPTKPDNPIPDDLPIPYPSKRLERTTVADEKTDAALAPISTSPTGLALFTQTVVRIAAGIVALAAAVVGLAMPPLSLAIPPVIVGICTSIVAIGTVLGIASQGVRATPAAPVAPPVPGAK